MPTRRDEAPLIVTALLDSVSFAILNEVRRRHFPPLLNKVPAHVSLFHNLPGAEVDRIVIDIAQTCAGRRSFALIPGGVRFLGRGVALAYESRDLRELHAELSSRWAAWLTAQDRQPFRAHVTIQNKVAPETARALFDHVKEQTPPECRIEGVSLWRYRNGPWEAVDDIRFADAALPQ